MNQIIIIAVCIIVVLNIILFFKIWGMTNNTKRMLAFLEAQRPDLIWQDADPNKSDFVDGYFVEGDEGIRPHLRDTLKERRETKP